MELEAEGLSTLLRACFCQENNRKRILMHWHAKRKLDGIQRLAAHFEEFINALLFEDMAFHLYQSHFLLFGPSLPIYKRWFLVRDEEHNIARLFTWLEGQGEHLFESIKHYADGQYDYARPRNFNPSTVVTVIHRRQLVRDFVSMIWAQESYGLRQEMLCAIQNLIAQHRSDIFLPNLHYACQRGGGTSSRLVGEILCQGLNQWDY